MSRTEFERPDVTQRKFDTPATIRQREIRRFGKMVRISPKSLMELKILNPLTGVKVPASNIVKMNPRSKMKVLETLMAKPVISGDELLATTLVVSSIFKPQNLDFTPEQYATIKRAIDVLKLPDDANAIGLQSFYEKSIDITQDRSKIRSWLMSNTNRVKLRDTLGIQDVIAPLTASKPVYVQEVSDDADYRFQLTPVSLDSVHKFVKPDGKYYLDMIENSILLKGFTYMDGQLVESEAFAELFEEEEGEGARILEEMEKAEVDLLE